MGPFFSPDGQWIGFFANRKLKKVAINGASVTTLADAPNPRGASWGDDNNIVAELHNSSGLMRVPAAGGAPQPITKLGPGENTHRFPQVLPGSRAVLFTSNTSLDDFDNASIQSVDVKTGKLKWYYQHAPGESLDLDEGSC